jgi:capsular exopolysaccharide synthesis family protein
MFYIKKYYKIFIFNLLLFLTLILILSFIQRKQKLFVWEARLIIEQNKRNSTENLLDYLYPTKEDEPTYQKVLDYIINTYTIKKFIISNNYNFKILQKEPKSMLIKEIHFYKPFNVGVYDFKTNTKNENYYIVSNVDGYVKIKFLDYDVAVREFLSKLNLKVTNSSEFIKSKNLPQFSPNMIYISFKSKEEYEGEIFKSFINFLFEENLTQKRETYSKLKTLISNQIDYYNREIENIDEKIKNVKLEIYNNPNFAGYIVNQIFLTQMEIQNLSNYLNNSKTIILTSDSIINEYLNKIRLLEDSVKVLSLRYGQESSEYKFLQMLIDSLKSNIRNVIKKRIIYLTEKLKVLKEQELEIKGTSDYVINLENELSKLNAQRQSLMEMLSLLNKKLKEIEMEEVSMKNDFKLFQISEKPIIESKLKSLPRNIMFSILFSIFFSLLLIFLNEYLKNTLRSLEEVQVKLNVKNVFEIPYVDNLEDMPFNICISRNYEKIFNGSYALESFRILVLKSIINQKFNLIGITSSVQGEGKSFITLNVSSILCMMKYKVILIDADLRRKSLTHYFQLHHSKGLSNFIYTDYRDLILKLDENLFFIPAGNEFIDPLSVFINQKFNKFLTFLSNEFNFVLLDLPPIIGISESSVISEYLGEIIFIIKYDETPIDKILHSFELINKEKIIAYVLNGVRGEKSYYEYYYYRTKSKTYI